MQLDFCVSKNGRDALLKLSPVIRILMTLMKKMHQDEFIVRITQKELADELGMSRSNVCIALDKLSELNVITKMAYAGIAVNPDMIFSGYPGNIKDSDAKYRQIRNVRNAEKKALKEAKKQKSIEEFQFKKSVVVSTVDIDGVDND